MSVSTPQDSRSPIVAPTNLKGWLILLAIYAIAGVVLGARARGPISPEDYEWQKWVGIVLQWAVFGGVIGATNHWLTGQFHSYGRAAVLFAILMPMFILLTEAVRLLAAWYTGGWETGVASVIVAALVGMAFCPLVTGLFVVLGKLLASVWPSAGSGTGSGQTGEPTT